MSPTPNPIYTHFKGKNLGRCELIERAVVETILNSKMPDVKRDWSKTFELKHSSSVTQWGRVLAQKRRLDPELAAIICVLHDIYVFKTGKAEKHAREGAPLARQMLEKTKKFSDSEMELIATAVYHHSDKHLVSKNPYEELVKDADAFDCSLFEGAHDAYLHEKSLEICKTYFARIKKVRKELGLPKDPQWDIFEYLKTK